MSDVSNIFGEGSAIYMCGPSKSHEVGSLAERIQSKALVNRESLTNILVQNFCFPETNRVILWRFLLQLPMNKDTYNIMAHQEMHKDIRTLPQRLPIKFSAVGSRLMRMLSSLTYWHPPLAECDWLPSLVFPFIQICERDSLIAFEIIATVITNWCSEWLHFVPNPPITILSRIDHIAEANGGEAPLSVAWPVLRSFFGEVATTKAALMILDNILAAKPVFIEYLVAAYAVMKDNVVDEQNVVALLKKARKMYKKDLKNNKMADTQFQPLPRGHYPVMVIVQKSPMWREKELQRIRSEAAATKQHMELSEQIEKESAKIERNRRNWMGERQMLKVIEQEQMAEFRRIERQTLCREMRKEKEALEERRKQLEKRRTSEMGAITEWRRECQQVREDISKSLEATKDTWKRWLDMKEEGAQLTRDEVDTEMALLMERGRAQTEEMDLYNNLMSRAAREEENLIQNVVTTSKQFDDELDTLREQLEQERRRQAEDFQARRDAQVRRVRQD